MFHFPPLPISARLALWYGLTLLLLLSGFAVFTYADFHLALHRDFDRHLTHEQREILPFVVVGDEGLTLEGLERNTSVAYTTNGVYGTYVRLLTAAGRVRYQSPNFAGHETLPIALPVEAEETSVSREWEALPVRTRYVPVYASGNVLAGWLEVSGFEWSLHRELHRLALTLGIGILVSVLFAFAGGWWLARRTLRPVRTLTEAAEQMSARDLSSRLPVDFGIRDELTELAETFNGLLARLDASVARERRFTANAAHELLTPLATLRSEVDVALRRERDAPAYREVLERLLLDVARMTDTVRGLLQLARVEAIVKRSEDRLNLSALVSERADVFGAQGAVKALRLEVNVVPGIVVTGEAAPLLEVVDNLLQNAIKYTPTGGRVSVQLTHGSGVAVLRVADSGAGFEAAEADRLFDRFYRSDVPAIQAESGSGLGLAIVKAIVEAYGGAVSSQSAGPGQGASFEVRLPCLACQPVVDEIANRVRLADRK